MIRGNEVRLQREHINLTRMLQRLYPEESNGKATFRLVIDIYNGEDIKTNLRTMDDTIKNLRRKNEEMFR